MSFVRSMTGFGQGVADLPGARILVELRSVNNRFADVKLRVPAELAGREAALRAKVLSRFDRGRVDVLLRASTPEGNEARPVLNVALLDEVLSATRALRERLGADAGPSVDGLLAVPGLFRTETVMPEWTPIEVAAAEEALERALDQLDAERRREGEVLRQEILGRLRLALGILDEIRRRAEQVPVDLRERLLTRLRALEGSVELDPARVAQEAAFLADRADVTEELVRLQGHLEQAAMLLEKPTGAPVGKRLDFLLQEIFREANTTGSKSADLELTRAVLGLKEQAEKIREQAQNLE